MLISIYRDTASAYGLCKDDGRCDNQLVVDVALETLEDYYNDSIAIYQDNPMPFKQWIEEEYTMDDMENLLGYIEDTEGNLNSVEVDKETL